MNFKFYLLIIISISFYATGNTTTGKTNIVEEDLVAVCYSRLQISLDDTGNATLLPEQVDAGSTDTAGPISYSLSRTNFDCSDIGSVIRVWLTVISVDGSTNSCYSDIAVEDKIPPTLSCLSRVVAGLGEDGLFELNPLDAVRFSDDNCGDISYTLSKSLFTCDDIGEQKITLTATDIGGNTTSCIFTLNIQDKIAPTISCQNELIVNPSLAEDVIINASDIIIQVYDNCAVTDYQLSRYRFSCTDVGVFNVFAQVVDGNGNTNSCSTSVVVEDSDCDGIADGCDICDGADDSIDKNQDGIPDCAQKLRFREYDDSWVCTNRLDRKKVLMCINGVTKCRKIGKVRRLLRRGRYVGPCTSCFTQSVSTRADDINTKEDKISLNVFPNPTSDVLNIEIDLEQQINQLFLYDISGRLIDFWADLEKDNLHINIHDYDLDSGVYYITARNTHSYSTTKVIISQ